MSGTRGGMKLGNTKLVKYGILDEDSDIRLHVAVKARRVYFFPTRACKRLVERDNDYHSSPAYTDGKVTGVGYLVPPGDIGGCISVEIPDDIFRQADFPKDQYDKKTTTSDKGNKAVLVATAMLTMGLFPITLKIEEVKAKTMQIKGLDIIVKTEIKIQVKCDWRAGHREFGGTGNLFIQMEECNPGQMY